jgi:hypothetical protein
MRNNKIKNGGLPAETMRCIIITRAIAIIIISAAYNTVVTTGITRVLSILPHLVNRRISAVPA